MPNKENPNKRRYMVIFDKDVFDGIAQIAKQEDRSPSYIVNRLSREYLQKEDK